MCATSQLHQNDTPSWCRDGDWHQSDRPALSGSVLLCSASAKGYNQVLMDICWTEPWLLLENLSLTHTLWLTCTSEKCSGCMCVLACCVTVWISAVCVPTLGQRDNELRLHCAVTDDVWSRAHCLAARMMSGLSVSHVFMWPCNTLCHSHTHTHTHTLKQA